MSRSVLQLLRIHRRIFQVRAADRSLAGTGGNPLRHVDRDRSPCFPFCGSPPVPLHPGTLPQRPANPDPPHADRTGARRGHSGEILSAGWPAARPLSGRRQIPSSSLTKPICQEQSAIQVPAGPGLKYLQSVGRKRECLDPAATSWQRSRPCPPDYAKPSILSTVF